MILSFARFFPFANPAWFAALLWILSGGAVSAQLTINGAGATFPAPLYQKWFSEYRRIDPSVTFNYQPIGSGGGQKQILAGTVDFGASDGPMSDESLAKAPGPILHVPTVAGAVVVTYNVPGDPSLKLDSAAVAGLFDGTIKNWNDARITSLNPGVNLPDLEVIGVHRSDGSGTTFIFTDYLSGVSPSWKSRVGTGPAVKWPSGQGAKGNAGVAGAVKQAEGAVGYVEMIFALESKMPFAEIQNPAGRFVKASASSVTAALAAARIPDDFRFSMTNSPGPDSYPICGATWLLIYRRQADPVKGRKLADFLRWAATKGEPIAESLDYSPLPDDLRNRVLKEIGSIEIPN